MAAFLNISADLFKRKYIRRLDNRYALIEKRTSNGQYDCIFLKDKQCQVYSARPKQCRTYPWWDHLLASEESWKAAAQECEGIHETAPLWTYDEIVKKEKL